MKKPKISGSITELDYKERKNSHHRAVVILEPNTLLTSASENIMLRISVRKKPTALLHDEDMQDIPIIRVNKTMMDGNGTNTVTMRTESYGDISNITVYIGRQDVEMSENIVMELIMSHSFDIYQIDMSLGEAKGWITLTENVGYFVKKSYNLFNVLALKDVPAVEISDYCTISLMITGDTELNDIFLDTDLLSGVELSHLEYTDDEGKEHRLFVLFVYYYTSMMERNIDGEYVVPHLDVYHKGSVESISLIDPLGK